MERAVSMSMELQKERKSESEKEKRNLWELSIQLLKKLKLTNLLNYRHGWQRLDSLEDTEQELILIIFEVIQKYENKSGKLFVNISDISDEDNNILKKNVIGQYRKKVWNHRSDMNMRTSDIYNIQAGEDDSHLHYTTMSINDVVDEKSVNIDVVDEAVYLREKLCHELIGILNTETAKIVESGMLGAEKGILTHEEIAKKSVKCRSSVTRRLHRGLSFLSEFISENNISWSQINNPTEKDVFLIKNAVTTYKNKRDIKRKHIKADLSIINVEYYLKSNRCSIILNTALEKENNEIRQLFSIRKRRNRKSSINTVIVHSVEEYLAECI